MALKKALVKGGNKNVAKGSNLDYDAEIKKRYDQIHALQKEIEDLQSDRLSLQIKPFKLGDHVLYMCPSGRTKKETKCVLESDGGFLYVRPFKNDGELSSRHFLVSPFSDYASLLKKC